MKILTTTIIITECSSETGICEKSCDERRAVEYGAAIAGGKTDQHFNIHRACATPFILLRKFMMIIYAYKKGTLHWGNTDQHFNIHPLHATFAPPFIMLR